MTASNLLKEIKNEIETDAKEDTKTMSENYETLKATVDAMTSDFDKFNSKKIKAAGQRARSNLLTIKKLCDNLRKQIISDIKEIPIKHRIDTDDSPTEEHEPPVEAQHEPPVEAQHEPPPAPPAEEPAEEPAPPAEEPAPTETPEPPKKVRKPRRANKKP